ncbi:MAG TPA: T9SS type A sorting domain-containing protein [Candidatus Kapabacteria bacterium]
MRSKFILLLLCTAAPCLAQWQKISSPYIETSSRPQTLTYKDGNLWLVNLDTVWMSSDEGASWSVRSPWDPSVPVTFEDVCFWDKNNGILTSTERVFLTRDAGITWDTIRFQENNSWGARFVADSNEIAIVVDRIVECHITRDGGKTWKVTPFPAFKQVMDVRTRKDGMITVLLLAPGTHGTFLATTYDYGNSWSFMLSGVDYDCFSFAFDPCDTNIRYIVNEETFIPSDNVAKFYYSFDRGSSWRESQLTNNMNYFSGAISVSPGSVLFMQTMTEGLIRSIDNGATWGSIGGPMGIPDTRLIHAHSDNTIYAADRDGSVWKTTNGGGTYASNPDRNKILAEPTVLFPRTQVSICSDSVDTLSYALMSCGGSNITSIVLDGTYKDEYKVTYQTGDSIIVKFTPKAAGQRAARILFRLDNGTTFTIPLLGEGFIPKGTLTVSPDTLFLRDTISVCSSLRQTFVISSEACVQPSITNAAITGAAQYDYTLSVSPPGTLSGSDTVTISFLPKVSGDRDAFYTIYLSDGRKITIPLVGRAIDDLTTATATTDSLFRNSPVQLCSKQTKSFVIRSSSCLPRSIASQSLWGSDASDYTLDKQAPLILTGNDTITITFTPRVAGKHNASYTLVIDNNTSIVVGLDADGIDTGYSLTISEDTLFTGDSVDLCSSREARFVISSASCVMPNVSWQTSAGIASGDYVLLRQAPSTLTGSDTIIVLFTPKINGMRNAEYMLMLSDSTLIRVPLVGTGINPPYLITTSPDSLFINDTLYLCEETVQGIRFAKSGCAILRVASQRIIGDGAIDYSILTPIPDSLTDNDLAVIRFAPNLSGIRNALYEITLDDSTKITIPLVGYGEPTRPLTLGSLDNLTTPTLGADISVPIIINGLHRSETVELTIDFNRNLEYHGTYSTDGSLRLDVPNTTANFHSRIRIPASYIKLDAISAYSRFTVYVDTEMTTLVALDSLSVISPLAPCAYTIDTRASCLISGPEGCGVVTISNFLRYGDVPELTIYPNPASGNITLTASKMLADVIIEIYDEIGVLHFMQEKTITSESGLIDTRSLASGRYFVLIRGSGFQTTLPLIIEQ